MEYLDISDLHRTDKWLDEVDMGCPYCHGERERLCREGDDYEGRMEKCPCHEGLPADPTDEEFVDAWDEECEFCDDTIPCEECGTGYFEVMWNTGYSVHLPYGSDREELKKGAWDNGFLLISWDGKDWLLMKGCGSDYTWKIHYARLQIQGYLDTSDIDRCLGSGGAHVFLGDDELLKMCTYFEKEYPTPENYEYAYRQKMEQIARMTTERVAVDKAASACYNGTSA